jgi:hypothetical protein
METGDLCEEGLRFFSIPESWPQKHKNTEFLGIEN